MRGFVLAMMMAVLAGPVLVSPAMADEFEPVRDRGQFLSLVEGRELRLGRYGVSLRVLPDGSIRGKALGWDVTGKWSWTSGYFCREMDWSGYPIPSNCQLVEQRGGELRFTSDEGVGRSAEFRLR